MAVAVLAIVVGTTAVQPQGRHSSIGVRLARMGSPTGREPRLIWTAERQGVWSQMRADYDANPLAPPTLGGQYYKLIKTNAECKCRYADTGLWATLMFQMTGDRKYVELAWAEVESSFLKLTEKQLSDNYTREYAMENVLLYDWLYPALSSEQRASFLAKLNEMFTVVLNNPANQNAPVRTADSDQTVGTYFGLAFLFTATGDHNPTASQYFHRPYVGGLTATARDRSSLRNAIFDYVSMASGGEWIEGTDYNLGTVRLLLLGAEGVRTATGIDHFPEITRWTASAALRPLYVVTPDLKESYQWGDTEHPGVFQGRLAAWQTTNGILAGLSDPSIGAHLQDHIYRLVETYGATGYATAEPSARMFLVFNPYLERAAPDSLPTAWFADGQGILTYRTGWAANASMFGAHMPARQDAIDHQVSYLGDFQLYRRGAWALTHPLSYGGPGLLGEGVNTMLHSGLGSMVQFRDVVGVERDVDGSFAYVAGTTGGQKYGKSYYQPPPTFLHEWTRSLVYLPARGQPVDAIVVFDRSHGDSPANLPRFERYSAADRNTILKAPALREWLIHMPVRPTITSDAIEWQTPEGDALRVNMLLPRERALTTIDESTRWPDTSVRAEQRKWHVRVTGATQQPFETFLNVVQAYGGGAPATTDLVTSNDRVEGVVVHRSGAPDMVVLFNASAGPRFEPLPNGLGTNAEGDTLQLRNSHRRSAGFTVQWQSSAGSTRIVIADLEPSKSWSYRLNGAGQRALPVSASGVATIVLDGARTYSLTVS
jgi:hypothetical protein